MRSPVGALSTARCPPIFGSFLSHIMKSPPPSSAPTLRSPPRRPGESAPRRDSSNVSAFDAAALAPIPRGDESIWPIRGGVSVASRLLPTSDRSVDGSMAASAAADPARRRIDWADSRRRFRCLSPPPSQRSIRHAAFSAPGHRNGKSLGSPQGGVPMLLASSFPSADPPLGARSTAATQLWDDRPNATSRIIRYYCCLS